MTGRVKPSKDRRTERRAQALRENLKRRKAQLRGRTQAESADTTKREGESEGSLR
jgi:hypothetical protein